MASTDKPPVASGTPAKGGSDKTAIDFLPDADEIERRPLPPMARITVHLLIAALVSFFVWAWLSEVDLIVTAKGRLVTPLPNIVVQPLETSIVQSIEVRAGQVVKKGDRLATLDPTFAAADGSQLKSKLDSLNTQWASLDAELSGGRMADDVETDTPDSVIQSRLSKERQASYGSHIKRQTESIARLRSSLETARRDEEGQQARVKGLREMEHMTDDLVNKKLAVKGRLLDVRDRLMEAERGAELARNRQVEIRRELSALEAEKAAYETGWRQKLLEEMLAVSRERDAISDQLQKANLRQSRVVLTAPADAVVLEVAKLSPGSIVKEAEPFFTLVPISDVLEAEVQIDSLDIGYIKIGSKSNLKIDAYPFQKHGTLEGSLRTVSQDAFRRDATSANVTDAYYGGRITLGNTRLDEMPANSTLLPGMTLTAEILVGKRSVLSYLLWPLTKAAKESIREP
ncbi:MAG: HlyD family type I secretion periplasmic adaptor subunit [Burkholderiales bacterium]|nr:HlyD family type I secretion periplasmic adaptor subunit [Burkholderiales bacterium]